MTHVAVFWSPTARVKRLVRFRHWSHLVKVMEPYCGRVNNWLIKVVKRQLKQYQLLVKGMFVMTPWWLCRKDISMTVQRLQQEDPGFNSWLHGVCMFSLCLCWFPLGTPQLASSQSPQTCMLGQLGTVNCPQVWMSVWMGVCLYMSALWACQLGSAPVTRNIAQGKQLQMTDGRCGSFKLSIVCLSYSKQT